MISNCLNIHEDLYSQWSKTTGFYGQFGFGIILVFICLPSPVLAMITGSFGELKENKLGSGF
jgi:hypothetical protein